MSARSPSNVRAARPSLAQLARAGLCREPRAKAHFHSATRTALAALADSLGIAQYRLYSQPQTPDLGGEIILEAGDLWLKVTATPQIVGQEVRYATRAPVDIAAVDPGGPTALNCASLDVFDTPDALVRRIQALLPCAHSSERRSDQIAPGCMTVLTRPHALDLGSNCHV